MKLRFTFIALCLFSIVVSAQTDKPTFVMQNYDDMSIVHTISDNGKWAIVKGALTEQRKNGVVRILDTETKQETVVKTASETMAQAKGKYVVNDITDDGTMAVGAFNGSFTDDGSFFGTPGIYDVATQTWKALPMPTGMNSAYVNSVTPDGRYAVGFCEDNVLNVFASNSSGVMWDVQNGKVMLLPGLPTMPQDYSSKQETYSQVSADGRYIVIFGNQSIFPTAFVYDRTETSYIKFGKGGNNAPSDFLMVEGAPVMSPSGRYVAATVRDINDNLYVSVYDTGTKTYVNYNSPEDYDQRAGFVDDNAMVYASSPSNTPLREWKVLCEGIWYPFSMVMSQRYGIDFNKSTGFDNTGTLWAGSADGRVLGSMVSPQGESFVMRMPEDMGSACKSIDLLQDFSTSPMAGSAFHWLSKVTLRFNHVVRVLGTSTCAVLQKSDGSVVRNSMSVSRMATDDHAVVVTFRETELAEGEQYTVVIPEGSICLDANDTKVNGTISISYQGRDNKPVSVVSCFPEQNSELARMDNTSLFPVLTFDTNVQATSSASARLVEVTTDGDHTVARLSVLVGTSNNKTVALMPSATQYLYAGASYKVVLEAGSLTDLSGSSATANAEVVLDYVGTYERSINTDDATIFSEDFSNPTQSYANFMLYEGDHNTPNEEMQGMRYDEDNTPWNLMVREYEESTDLCAASHSMYDPAGRSDDWMVVPQILVPDEYCTLTFDVQKYHDDKDDELKVVIWENDENLNFLTSSVIEKIKAEGDVYSFMPTIGETEEGLEGEWESQAIDLAKYKGKKVYICFWNNNENQSMVFVDNVRVIRNLKYLLSLSSAQKVVGKESIAIAGKLTINSDVDTYTEVELMLKDAEGNTISTFAKDGLSLRKNDEVPFAFDKPLPLQVGEVNSYTISVRLDTYQDVVKGSIQDLAFEPVKRVVLEECTGTTCPNCPQGILAIENLEKIHGDRIIPISLHTYDGDPYSNTALESYSLSLGLTAAPSAMIQRNGWILSPMGTNDDGDVVFSNGYNLWQDAVSREMDVPTYIGLSVPEATYDENTGKIDLSIRIESALNMKNQYINIFPVALEDSLVNVQVNTFYMATDPAFGDWGKGGKYGQPTAYDVVHNDVARTYWGEITGSNIGFPQTLEAGKSYTQPLTLSYPDIVSSFNHGKLVLMAIDGNVGTFLNAIVVPFANLLPTGIDLISADSDVRLTVGDGTVTAEGDGAISLALYQMDGTMLSSGNGQGKVVLSAEGYNGVVLVRANTARGTLTRKVVF